MKHSNCSVHRTGEERSMAEQPRNLPSGSQDEGSFQATHRGADGWQGQAPMACCLMDPSVVPPCKLVFVGEEVSQLLCCFLSRVCLTGGRGQEAESSFGRGRLYPRSPSTAGRCHGSYLVTPAPLPPIPGPGEGKGQVKNRKWARSKRT